MDGEKPLVRVSWRVFNFPMGPKHPAAARFLNSGLFEGLTCFAELEQQISALPEATKVRGDAFEVFAEAYLATQKQFQAEDIWPSAVLPEELKRVLNLPPVEQGADGIYLSKDGEYGAYQAKFRTGRPNLTWRELSTFFGVSDKAAERLVFTNSDAISGTAEQRPGFYAVRGTDLDGLEARDFDLILDFLRGKELHYERKKPLPHQGEAIRNVVSELSAHDRATLIMACGTGKTLVALWVAEELNAKRVLVLVPSLSLVQQTLHEWLKETNWEDVSYCCICSDPSVANDPDGVVIHPGDADFPITTNVDEARRWLSKTGAEVSFVFSTYQSSGVVAEASKGLPPFDLAIFDEAHKTAGREGRKSSLALDDQRLPIRKRLSQTATPRLYSPLKKDKEGDAQLVFSMDRPEVYGETAHTLSFAEAAKRKIICDYKVIISVVTTEMLNDYLLSKGETMVVGDPVRSRQVAGEIALAKAVEEHGIERIFTFHGSVKAAQSFVAEGGEGVQNHLPQFDVFHVNGKMPAGSRKNTIKAFAEAESGLVSNARCLTEGVDVPAVDMVGFMSPKRSKIDIAQAVGRAMRKPKGSDKEVGYVLLPIFVEAANEESTEEALARSEYEEIWDVLGALKDIDEDFAEIISTLREEKGRTGGFDEKRLREKVEVLGPLVSLDALYHGVATTLVKILGNSWDEMYGQLLAYKSEHGDCKVPAVWPKNPRLANWVNNNRRYYKQGKVAAERIRRLEEIGFIWDALDALWEEMFVALIAYKGAHDDCKVPDAWSENPQLANWVTVQRRTYKQGKLSPERIRRLEEIGFVWVTLEAAWEGMFTALIAYKDAHNGDCNVPNNWPGDRQLGTWVSEQRKAKMRGKLSPERIRRLEEIGFVWVTHEAAWERMFTTLLAHRDAHGNCNVPKNWPQNPILGRWVRTQRSRYNRGKLSDERIRRLEEIGFVWGTLEPAWEEMFTALLAYRDAHGDCNVPQVWPENPKLASWVRTQRRAYKHSKVEPERIRRLEEIGFVWVTLETYWEGMFTALLAYKDAYGNCDVPKRWPENRQLGTWVGAQRALYKRGKVAPERTRRLEEIGFIWDTLETAWEEMFTALIAYKDAHGDCNVPNRWPENRQLGTWVSKQRAFYKRGKVAPERTRRLEEIGFIWDTLETAWEEMFTALIAYKDAHNGDCNVPRNWPQNLKLGPWVHTQRSRYNRGKLSPERTRRLEEVGFLWSVGK